MSKPYYLQVRVLWTLIFQKPGKYEAHAFIKIETDSGITGIGETYAGYFFPESVPGIVEFFKPILLGNDVEDIPGLWGKNVPLC